MTKMSTLPSELTEEILFRVPITSLWKVRLTCKNWNTLSKDSSFRKKYLDGQAKVLAAVEARGKEFLPVVTMMDDKVRLTSVNLHKNVKSSDRINHQAKVISLDDTDQIDVHQVFHCDGLLLCIMKDKTRIVVWNPYTRQTRWNVPVNEYKRGEDYKYALGYEKSSKSCLRSYKILRFIYTGRPSLDVFELYYLNSNSWRVLDVTLNTYWVSNLNGRGVLLCFDFTTERFAPPLPFPFESRHKIEPSTVSWSKKYFLAMNMEPLSQNPLSVCGASFFIDEEKKVVVIFDQWTTIRVNYYWNLAYIVGVDGSMETVYLGGSAYKYGCPLVCSYVPSLVQLN